MVAVTAPGASGAVRRRLAVRRVRLLPRLAVIAGAAGTALRVGLSAVLALRALAGVVLVAFGAWLAWPPAGFIVAGVALLADRLHDARSRGEGPDA